MTIINKIIEQAYWLNLKSEEDIYNRLNNIPEKFKYLYGIGPDKRETIDIRELGFTFKNPIHIENQEITKGKVNPQDISLIQLYLSKWQMFLTNEYLKNGFKYVPEYVRVAGNTLFGNGNHRIAHLKIIGYDQDIEVNIVRKQNG